MDIKIVHFYRQYLQQLDEISYPAATVLLEPAIQDEISCSFFDASNGQYLPPVSYQRRVLKEIMNCILSAIQDPNEDVCFLHLALHFVSILCPFAIQDVVPFLCFILFFYLTSVLFRKFPTR
jgi:hypothetical protein